MRGEREGMEGREGKGGEGRSGGVVGCAAAGVAKWPKFRLKSSKGAGEKKCWPEEFVAKNWPNFFQNLLNFFHALARKFQKEKKIN